MVLRFYAREGLVREPGRRPVIGQVVAYLGRGFVPPSKRPDGSIIDAALPATKAGFEWDTDKHEHSHNEHVLRAARRGAFWPADKATADALGVPLVDLDFKDGAFAEKSKPAARTGASARSE